MQLHSDDIERDIADLVRINFTPEWIKIERIKARIGRLRADRKSTVIPQRELVELMAAKIMREVA